MKKNKRFKRKHLILIIMILLSFILGMLNLQLVTIGIWDQIHSSLGSVPVYIHFIYWLLSFCLVIIVHELGHFFSFVANKIKIKAIYILAIAIVFNDKKIKVHFIPSFLKMLGGLVIPIIPIVDSKETEDKITNIVGNALLAGPRTSIAYCIIVCILTISLFFISPYYILNGFLFTLSLSTIIYTVLIVRASKVSYKGLNGDYAAFKKLKNDKMYRTIYVMSSSLMFSKHEKTLNYYWPSIIELLENKRFNNDLMQLNLYRVYLEAIIHDGMIGSTKIDEVIKGGLLKVIKTEDGLVLRYTYLYYQYLLNNIEDPKMEIENINGLYDKVDEKVKEYWYNYSLHILNLQDLSEYFINLKSDPSSSENWLLKPILGKVEIPDKL